MGRFTVPERDDEHHGAHGRWGPKSAGPALPANRWERGGQWSGRAQCGHAVEPASSAGKVSRDFEVRRGLLIAFVADEPEPAENADDAEHPATAAAGQQHRATKHPPIGGPSAEEPEPTAPAPLPAPATALLGLFCISFRSLYPPNPPLIYCIHGRDVAALRVQKRQFLQRRKCVRSAKYGRGIMKFLDV